MLACSKAVSIKWVNSNFARTVWRFWLTACKNISAADYSNASFEQCRVVLVVCYFSDNKCRHCNVCNATRKKTVKVIIISNYVPIGCNKCLVYNGFLLFLSRRAKTWHHNTERNISVSHLRYSANHNALDRWPIRARLASQNDELCKNQHVSERLGIEEQQ